MSTGGGTSARTSADRFTYEATHKVAPGITLTLSPEEASAGDYSNFDVQIEPTMDGEVQFYFDGASLGAPARVLFGSGSAYKSELVAGTHQVKAVFTPIDSDFYATVTAEATLTVSGEASTGKEPESGGEPPAEEEAPTGEEPSAGKEPSAGEEPPPSAPPGSSLSGSWGGPPLGGSDATGSENAPSAEAGHAVSADQVKAALKAALEVLGKQGRIGALLKHGGYVLQFAAPSAGKLVVRWYLAPTRAHSSNAHRSNARERAHAGRQVLVAKLSAVLRSAGAVKKMLRLTRKGRKLLHHAKRLTLTAIAGFTQTGGTTRSVTRKLVLRR